MTLLWTNFDHSIYDMILDKQWTRLASSYKVPMHGTIKGSKLFLLLFINYSCLTMLHYCPCFTIEIFILLCYLTLFMSYMKVLLTKLRKLSLHVIYIWLTIIVFILLCLHYFLVLLLILQWLFSSAKRQ